MLLEAETFRVKDAVLWPTACPACAYSWMELPGPRCPECGERVEEGEVVIVGRKVEEGGFGETWGGGMVAIFGMLIFAGAVMTWLHGMSGVVVIAVGGCGAWLMVLHTMASWHRRRRGFPKHVVRLGPEGFRLGVLERKGRVRPWGRALSVVILRDARGWVRIRGIRYWGWVAVNVVFEAVLQMSVEQEEGIVERIKRWSAGQTRVRRMA